jgi:hypothetical protein
MTDAQNNPRVVIVTPTSIVPQILEDAHGHLLAGHDGLLKTKERILLLAWHG